MNPLISQLKKLRAVKMTPHEKIDMRMRVQSFVASHPSHLSTQKQIPSPIGHLFHVSRFMQVALAVLLIFVAGGSGLAYASQSALPGDLLYPFKVHVAEKVATSLSFTTEARATVLAEHVKTRLSEIDTLKKANLLDTRREEAAQVALIQNSDELANSLSDLSHEGKQGKVLAVINDLRPSFENTNSDQVALSGVAQTSTIAPMTFSSKKNNDTDKSNSSDANENRHRAINTNVVALTHDMSTLNSVINAQKEKILTQGGEQETNTQNTDLAQNEGPATTSVLATLKTTSLMQNNEDETILQGENAGIVQGVVTITVECPGALTVTPCTTPSESYTTKEILITPKDSTNIIKQKTLEDTGKFSFKVTPGTYTVKIQNSADQKILSSKEVLVKAGEKTSINFSLGNQTNETTNPLTPGTTQQ